MEFLKKRVTELDAAVAFTRQVMTSAEGSWPQIYAGLREAHGSSFAVDDERFAMFDLAIAAMATDMQALQNLFPADQAERLLSWVVNVMNSPEYGDYFAEEVKAYSSAWQQALNSPEPRDAMSAIPARLLHRWLGPRLGAFTVELGGQHTDIISPMLVTHVMTIVMGFVGFWKSLKQGYRLVPSDLPPDHKFGGR